jgi:hypothetical protein
MFNFFKKPAQPKGVEELMQTIKGVADAVKPIAPPAPVEQPVEPDQPVYQIGKTAKGKITFRMQHDHGYTTLTMNNEGVDQLIRMLEAAKEPEEVVDQGNPTDE